MQEIHVADAPSDIVFAGPIKLYSAEVTGIKRAEWCPGSMGRYEVFFTPTSAELYGHPNDGERKNSWLVSVAIPRGGTAALILTHTGTLHHSYVEEKLHPNHVDAQFITIIVAIVLGRLFAVDWNIVRAEMEIPKAGGAA